MLDIDDELAVSSLTTLDGRTDMDGSAASCDRPVLAQLGEIGSRWESALALAGAGVFVAIGVVGIVGVAAHLTAASFVVSGGVITSERSEGA